MKYYVGIDLHSNNSYVAVIDENGVVKYQQRLSNDSNIIINSLKDFGSDIVGVAVESTFNWYWLVDALEKAGFRVHLWRIPERCDLAGKYAQTRDIANRLYLSERGPAITGFVTQASGTGSTQDSPARRS